MSDGGRYKGPRDPRSDYFDDVMGDNEGAGIFAGQGFQDFERVDTRANQQGILIDTNCRVCGRRCNVVVEWAELFVGAHAPQTGVLPPGWKRSDVNATMYPEVHCRCGALVAPQVSPDWAAKQVNLALQNGLLTQQALAGDYRVQQLGAILQQQRQPGGG